MYPEFMIVQILKIGGKAKVNPYVVRNIGCLEEFWYDFKTKSSLKKFFDEREIENGEYIILHENEADGDRYILDSVISYKRKEKGTFLEMNAPGKKWVDLVRKAMDTFDEVALHGVIKVTNKVTIPNVELK